MDETRQQIYLALKELRSGWREFMWSHLPKVSRAFPFSYFRFLREVMRENSCLRNVMCDNMQDRETLNLYDDISVDMVHGFLQEHVGKNRSLDVMVSEDYDDFTNVYISVTEYTKETDLEYLQRLTQYVNILRQATKTREQEIAELEAKLKVLKGE